MTSPTWYDLLGVAPDASSAEIKAAWRDATDKFEPGSGAGQFRLFNEAADVLLDPQRRNAYDAELAGATTAGADSAVVAQPTTATEPEPDAPEPHEPAATQPDEPVAGEPNRLYAAVTSTATLAVLAVLAVGSLILASVLFLTSNVDKQADTYNARRDAQAVAQRALNAALSYDYRRLDTDKATATSYMTAALSKKFLKSYTYNANPSQDSPATAVARKVSVQANVLATGVMDGNADRVRLLVFVDQQVIDIDNPTGTNRENRVVATLVHRGGKWLLDDLKSLGTDYPDSSAAVPSPTPSATPTP